ncbi:MAG: NAD(P)/FAD-dependent oxidoreductase [bacterium]|nr:NAD(P)/FAD-dependent oxidoreductase [bacterium]
MTQVDAVVVGSGPNGLAAAITLARAGCKVVVYEAKPTIGGGVRSMNVTLPGFVHDICSAIHPLTLVSPFFKTVPFEQYRLSWVFPPVELAHPLDDEPAVLIHRSVEATAAGMGRDAAAYRGLFGMLNARADDVFSELLSPLNLPPKKLMGLLLAGLPGVLPAAVLARRYFKDSRARAAFAGMAAHSILSLDQVATGAFGVMLGLSAHAAGWAFPRGGAQKIPDALAAYLRDLGGEIVCDHPIESLDQLPPAKVVLFDTSPRTLAQVAGKRLNGWYAWMLRHYRYGAGVFKVDYALSAPIPWQDPHVAQAGTVHLGGTLDEIAHNERAVTLGAHPERPFVLLAQHTLFDDSRAPHGQHTAWAYCHVPNGSTVDMLARLENQIERFAPGFRDVVLARSVRNTYDMEAYNANYVGGDINSGAQDILQQFTRPVWQPNPYATPMAGIYLCSSATPPGGGVHGMSGYFAAQSALKHL